MSSKTTVSVSLERDDGSILSLSVECSVSGSYVAATYEQPAEGPEVEAVSAKLEAIQDKDGAESIHEPALVFDLDTLSSKETSRLDDLVYRPAVDRLSAEDSRAYEDEMERRADARREEGF